MEQNDLQASARTFASRVRTLVRSLPRIDKRLLRDVELVESNCHAAYRAKSPTDFVTKMAVAKERVEASLVGLDMLGEDGKLVVPGHAEELIVEGKALVAMMIDAISAAEQRRT